MQDTTAEEGNKHSKTEDTDKKKKPSVSADTAAKTYVMPQFLIFKKKEKKTKQKTSYHNIGYI